MRITLRLVALKLILMLMLMLMLMLVLVLKPLILEGNPSTFEQ
jgi:hypothetical protein